MTTKVKGSHKQSKGSIRAKAGLPARAGKRKPPAKAGPHVTTAAQRGKDKGKFPQPRAFTPGTGFQSTTTVPEHSAPSRAYFKKAMSEIDMLERRTAKSSISDPFMFNRMRAHARVGVYYTQD